MENPALGLHLPIEYAAKAVVAVFLHLWKESRKWAEAAHEDTQRQVWGCLGTCREQCSCRPFDWLFSDLVLQGKHSSQMVKAVWEAGETSHHGYR